MKGYQAFSSLVGLVFSDNGGLQRYLSEIPARGGLLHQLDTANEANKPVSWTRRRRWCRQLIKAIAELHSDGFVHGSLGRCSRNGVFFDGYDNLKLLNNFRRSFDTYFNSLLVPPEYVGFGAEPRERAASRKVAVQPAVDIFQLGFQLWTVAGNRTDGFPVHICRLLCCSTPANYCCP